jgi:hypothetical protein
MPLTGAMGLSLSALMAAVTTPVPDVVWMDLARLPALAREAARREALAVLADAGLNPRWRVGRAQDLIRPHELTVTLLPHDRAAREGGARVMGACHARAGGARVWIYLDAVSWTLGLPADDRPQTPEQAFRLGRALGRIVAHEFIHAVAPAVGHARSGVMAARLGRGELTAGRLRVDAQTRRAMHGALSAARPAMAVPGS